MDYSQVNNDELVAAMALKATKSEEVDSSGILAMQAVSEILDHVHGIRPDYRVGTGIGDSIISSYDKLGMMTEAQLKSMGDNQNAPAFIRMASRALVRCMSDDRTSGGVPVAGAALEALLDRTVGKSKQQIEINQHTRTDHVIQMTAETLEAMRRIGAGETAREVISIEAKEQMPVAIAKGDE